MSSLTRTIKHIMLLAAVFIFPQNSLGQAKASDTTFISRRISNGIYHAIYVESDKKSKYYDRITNFEFDHDDSLLYSLIYQRSTQAIFNGDPLPKIEISPALPLQWCGLNSYKGKFYLYAPSDWGLNRNVIITDSTITTYIIEGPVPHPIDGFKSIDQNTFEFSFHGIEGKTSKMTIHVIDWENQIAVFDNHAKSDDFRYSLKVGASKARQFPIVVNHCKDVRQLEFNFDKTNFKKLLAQKP